MKCKHCGAEVKKEKMLEHKKTSWSDPGGYKFKKEKFWYFCDKVCQFEFLDLRGKKKRIEKRKKMEEEMRLKNKLNKNEVKEKDENDMD